MIRDKIVYRFGPKRALSDPGLPVVCCLVRDGAYWLPSFLDHYRKAGVKDFFFLDNGSSDATLEMLKKESGVGVYSVHSSYFKNFNHLLRRYLLQIVRPEGWVLGVDIDEYFDYPCSNRISLTQLCQFLDDHQYNSMSTHMLDMFPEGPIGRPVEGHVDDPRITQPFYSLEGLKTSTFQSLGNMFEGLPSNTLDLPDMRWKFYCDGVRFRKFGLGLWLTKHALFKVGAGLIPFHHPHVHCNMRIANISGVLYHYKFSPFFARQIDNALRERQYHTNSHDYVYYSNAITSCQDLVLKDDGARRLESVDELVDLSFLDVPGDFKTYFDNREGNFSGAPLREK